MSEIHVEALEIGIWKKQLADLSCCGEYLLLSLYIVSPRPCLFEDKASTTT
jgi:hypothetical protein